MSETDPFSLGETAELLRSANRRIDEAGLGLDELEKGQSKLITYLHSLLDLVHKLEIERNTWKFAAEQLEISVNQWESKCGVLEEKLRTAWRVAAELGVRTGEARCPNCGSGNVFVNAGDYGTGVFAPDGTEERHYQCCLKCEECDHYEELVP